MERDHPNAVVLHCFDPLGREVVARLGQWKGHIEGRHPEVDEHFDSVQRAIERPEQITIDAINSNRENYYCRGALPAPYDRLFLKICVAYRPGNSLETYQTGEVITAYPTKRIGRGEAPRWP
ncbi:MAG: hypothetical protein H0W59_02270 [Chloroflexia bacterium]|jgi:hypothetical protein|nr:hypothetical protein [Chloroflexia bacterium]